MGNGGGRRAAYFYFYIFRFKKAKKKARKFFVEFNPHHQSIQHPALAFTFLPLGNKKLTQVYFTVWRKKKKMSYEPKNILITGGAGFIASHVAILFAKKYPHCKVSLCIV